MTQQPVVQIVYGPQGAGKTTLARQLSVQQRAIRFSIDEWMVRLFGSDLPQSPEFSWVTDRVGRCESAIWEVATQILAAGGNVVLDLGFMRVADRERFAHLALAAGVQAEQVFVDAPQSLRRERVAGRNAQRSDTYALNVTPAMFDFMEGLYEPPGEGELARSAVVQAKRAGEERA